MFSALEDGALIKNNDSRFFFVIPNLLLLVANNLYLRLNFVSVFRDENYNKFLLIVISLYGAKQETG